MQPTQVDPLLDVLVNDCGGNYFFALDFLEQYRRDPQAVDASWRQYFDRLVGGPPKAAPAAGGNGPVSSPAPAGEAWTAGTAGATPAPAAGRPGTLVREGGAAAPWSSYYHYRGKPRA